jgi:hypothetical protein
MLGQAISLAAAAMILFAYGAHQLGRMDRDGFAYLLLNLAGSVALTVFAARARQAGLTFMEGAWALISAASLARRAARRG